MIHRARYKLWIAIYAIFFFICISYSLILSMQSGPFGTLVYGGEALLAGHPATFFIQAVDSKFKALPDAPSIEVSTFIFNENADHQATELNIDTHYHPELKATQVTVDLASDLPPQTHRLDLTIEQDADGQPIDISMLSLPLVSPKHIQRSYQWRTDQTLTLKEKSFPEATAIFIENGELVRGLENRLWIVSDIQPPSPLSWTGLGTATRHASWVEATLKPLSEAEGFELKGKDDFTWHFPLRHLTQQIAQRWDSSPVADGFPKRLSLQPLLTNKAILVGVWSGQTWLSAQLIPAGQKNITLKEHALPAGLFHVSASQSLQRSEKRTAMVVGWNGQLAELVSLSRQHFGDIPRDDDTSYSILMATADRITGDNGPLGAMLLSRIHTPKRSPTLLSNSFHRRQQEHRQTIGKRRALIHRLLVAVSFLALLCLGLILYREQKELKTRLSSLTEESFSSPRLTQAPWWLFFGVTTALLALGWVLFSFLDKVYWNW